MSARTGWAGLLASAALAFGFWLAPVQQYPVLGRILIAFGILVLAGEGAASFAEHRRALRLPASKSAASVLASAPAVLQRSIELPRESSKFFADVEPSYLTGLFNQHTTIQADRLIEAYRGKWMAIAGAVKDVVDHRDYTSVLLAADPDKTTVHLSFDPSVEMLATLRRGQKIRIIGEISDVDHLGGVSNIANWTGPPTEGARPRKEDEGTGHPAR